jgi:hypothetical protein
LFLVAAQEVAQAQAVQLAAVAALVACCNKQFIYRQTPQLPLVQVGHHQLAARHQALTTQQELYLLQAVAVVVVFHLLRFDVLQAVQVVEVLMVVEMLVIELVPRQWHQASQVLLVVMRQVTLTAVEAAAVLRQLAQTGYQLLAVLVVLVTI